MTFDEWLAANPAADDEAAAKVAGLGARFGTPEKAARLQLIGGTVGSES